KAKLLEHIGVAQAIEQGELPRGKPCRNPALPLRACRRRPKLIERHERVGRKGRDCRRGGQRNERNEPRQQRQPQTSYRAGLAGGREGLQCRNQVAARRAGRQVERSHDRGVKAIAARGRSGGSNSSRIKSRGNNLRNDLAPLALVAERACPKTGQRGLRWQGYVERISRQAHRHGPKRTPISTPAT